MSDLLQPGVTQAFGNFSKECAMFSRDQRVKVGFSSEVVHETNVHCSIVNGYWTITIDGTQYIVECGYVLDFDGSRLAAVTKSDDDGVEIVWLKGVPPTSPDSVSHFELVKTPIGLAWGSDLETAEGHIGSPDLSEAEPLPEPVPSFSDGDRSPEADLARIREGHNRLVHCRD